MNESQPDRPSSSRKVGSEEEVDQSNVDLNSITQLIPPTRIGEAKAREQLFHELKSYLESVANRQLIADLQPQMGVSAIVQTSFVRIVEKFDPFRGHTSGELRARIRTIVKNEIQGLRVTFRLQKRNVKREQLIQNGETAWDPIDPHLTPSTGAIRSEQMERIEEALSRLSDEDDQVIRFRNFESMPSRKSVESWGAASRQHLNCGIEPF
ncbi:MAG: ECF-type sigma factor [Pirellulaceae bacterium]